MTCQYRLWSERRRDECRTVLDAREIEPRRGERGGGEAPVARGLQLLDPARLLPARADVDEGPHEIADHVMQESIRAKREGHQVLMPRDTRFEDGADRGSRLALGIAKGAEVVFADHRGTGLAHALDIERDVKPTDALPEDRRRDRLVPPQGIVGPGKRPL